MKFNPDEYTGECEIDGALGLALFGHGLVTGDIAERMGYREGYFSWDCPEREP